MHGTFIKTTEYQFLLKQTGEIRLKYQTGSVACVQLAIWTQ